MPRLDLAIEKKAIGEQQGLSQERLRSLSRLWNEPEWALNRRLQAWEAYRSLPFPSAPDEEWRRVHLTDLDLERFSTDRVLFEKAVFPQRWTREGLVFTDLSTAFRERPTALEPYFSANLFQFEENKLTALQGALYNGGFFLHVPKNLELDTPLRWTSVAKRQGVMDLPLYLVVVEAGSRVTIVVEEHAASSTVQIGRMVVVIHEGAKVELARLIKRGPAVWGFSTDVVRLERDAGLDWSTFCTGGRLTKLHQRVRMEGPGGNAFLAGIFSAKGREQMDFQTRQDHFAPHTTSDLLYKGALKDRARTVFRGVVWLDPSAQRSDAYQSNQNLLLSDHARADSIPVLEILANDVRCKHGATVGTLDQEQVFYAMARGLPRPQAEKMIVEGFFEPVIQKFPAVVRKTLRRELRF